MLDRMNSKDILEIIVERYKEILKENLVGVYLKGSDVFDYDKSGIDFIVVIKEKLKIVQKEEMIELLLDLNQFAPEKGFEMSVVLLEHTKNFKYPTPFELYFSNDHINNYRKDLTGYSEKMHGTDKGLAVYFRGIKEKGIVFYGSEIEMVFGEVSNPEK